MLPRLLYTHAHTPHTHTHTHTHTHVHRARPCRQSDDAWRSCAVPTSSAHAGWPPPGAWVDNRRAKLDVCVTRRPPQWRPPREQRPARARLRSLLCGPGTAGSDEHLLVRCEEARRRRTAPQPLRPAAHHATRPHQARRCEHRTARRCAALRGHRAGVGRTCRAVSAAVRARRTLRPIMRPRLRRRTGERRPCRVRAGPRACVPAPVRTATAESGL